METLKIDVTGEECPIPLITLKQALKKAANGQLIEIRFTCPQATVNLPDYCESEGIEVIGLEREKKGWKFTVRK